ncbi:MAG: sugar ABC transporter substrate-binding protein [Treponema sp.]
MKKSRKNTAVFMAVLFGIAFGVTGCTAAEQAEKKSAQSETAGGQKRMKIWFDTGGGPGESYGTVLQNGAAAAAKDLGVDISFVYSDWSAEKMLKNFREGLASKPDGMVVIGVPGDDAYEPLIDEAFKQGTIVTCVDTPLPRLYQKYQNRGFGSIGPDNYNQGKMLAERSIDYFKLHKDDKVFVWGLKSIPGRGRRAQAIIDTFEKAGLHVDYLEISPEANKDATLGAPILTGYLSANKDCKLAVIDHGALTAQAGNALRSAGIDPDSVAIAGFSLSPATAEGIKEGYIDLVSEGQPYLIGYLAVTTVLQTQKAGFGGLVIDTAGGFVTKENIDTIAPLAEKGIR